MAKGKNEKQRDLVREQNIKEVEHLRYIVARLINATTLLNNLANEVSNLSISLVQENNLPIDTNESQDESN
jgi:hypothetical protein